MYREHLRGTPIPDDWTMNEGRNLRPLEKGMLVRTKGMHVVHRIKSVTPGGATLDDGRQIALYSAVEYKRSRAYQEELAAIEQELSNEGLDSGSESVIDSLVMGEDGPQINRQANKEKEMGKVEKNAKAKAAAPAVEEKSEKAVKATAPKKEKVVKEPQPCVCGCAGTTSSYFVPGHDARFKGWLNKLANGKATLADTPMPKAVVKALGPWKEKGDGLIPSKTYQELRES